VTLGTIWSGIQSKIAGPVKWVISHVYNNGIRKMWNSIAGKISSKITLPAIRSASTRAASSRASGNGDTVPAMLARASASCPTAQVTQLGGHRGIDAMLGKDRPTKTGGNPTRQQERKPPPAVAALRRRRHHRQGDRRHRRGCRLGRLVGEGRRRRRPEVRGTEGTVSALSCGRSSTRSRRQVSAT
jgi:hypothetical protein